ncbi:MAG: hypothetical protein SGILL_008452, partial [Bacillariaceae sp.]
MVRGNWQRRVEKTKERRQEAKQRKHRQENKKIYKSQAHELMGFLDKHSSAWKDKKIMHIWTDSIPSNAPPILDIMGMKDDNGMDGGTSNSRRKTGGRKGRNRSNTIESEGSATGKKKVHPRSKEAAHAEEDTSETDLVPKLCKSHFFTGKCSFCVGGKKGNVGCRFVHHKKNTTLGDILKHGTNGKQELLQSEQALSDPAAGTKDSNAGADDNNDVDEDPTMDMVYYVSIRIQDLSRGTEKKPSESIAEEMTQQGCSVGSIVYFALDDLLLYDRYRNGTLLDDKDMTAEDHHRQSSSEAQAVVLLLPASILEHTLTFLEDNAVPALCSVCKPWHREIGKQSANLWKHLLLRRNLPLPINQDEDELDADKINDKEENPNAIHEEMVRMKEAFLSHYVAMRDMNAIQSGIAAMMFRKSMDDREGCFRSFESIRGSPQVGNPCVTIKIWSPNRFLVAYRQDCSIRLFDSVEKGGANGNRICRELISRSMDPYQNTKKRCCNFIDMALDEQYVGCLLHVTEEGTKAEANILTILSRDEFLIHDESAESESSLQVIDVGQSVLNYLLSCDDVDHGLLQLHDFLRDGGDLDDVEVLISPKVAVSIPLMDTQDEDEDDSDANMTLLFRKFFLLSSTMGAIIWMADNRHLVRNDDMTLTSLQTQDGGRFGSRVAAVATNSSLIVSVAVDPAGTFQHPTSIRQPGQILEQTLQDGTTRRQLHHRPLVVLDTDVVCGQNVVLVNQSGKKQYQANLVFFRDAFKEVHKDPESVALDGCIKIDHLVKLRSRHLLVICTVHTSTSNVNNNEQVNFLEDLVGHWFGEDDAEAAGDSKTSLYGILIDVPSRKEVQRVCFVEDLTSTGVDTSVDEEGFPLHLAADGGTVAAAAWWTGVVLTGVDARDARLDCTPEADNHDAKTSSAKKKKKKGAKKSNKKDGFARGMSLRG